MYKSIPWPNFSEEEAEIAKRVLLSNKVNYWTGTEAREFEKEYASFFDSKAAIALANGTVAMDLALKALNISEGDEVIVTSRSFIASASTVVNSGARPVFAEVDPQSQNITPETVSAVITAKTKAVICVHLAGWPCELDELQSLCNSKGIVLIEDCAQAHGARFRGQSVGSFGVVGAWSFCQDKIMTTAGEGGMITTSDEDLYRTMWSFKDHGKSLEKLQQPSTSTAFRWIHDSIGTNWRLTEIQAAIGRYQLGERLNDWVAMRTANAVTLNRELAGVDGIRLTVPPSHVKHAYYKYYFFLEPQLFSSDWSRDRLLAEINGSDVPCFTGSCPEIYREQAFVDLYGEHPGHAVARKLGETSMVLNIHPGVTEEHVVAAAAVIRQAIAKAVK